MTRQEAERLIPVCVWAGYDREKLFLHAYCDDVTDYVIKQRCGKYDMDWYVTYPKREAYYPSAFFPEPNDARIHHPISHMVALYTLATGVEV